VQPWELRAFAADGFFQRFSESAKAEAGIE
jgi:hypothetical protein